MNEQNIPHQPEKHNLGDTEGSMPAANQETSGTNKKQLWTAAILALVLAGGIAAWAAFSGSSDSSNSGPVAVVNGEEISREKYDQRYAQTQAQYQQSGVDVEMASNQEQIKTEVIDNLIAERLLVQAAVALGVQADDETIDAQIAQTKTQFPDEESFNAAILAEGYTESEFRARISDQLTIQNYVSAHVDVEEITVTDEEVEALYNQSVTGLEDAPPLVEVREQVEAGVVNQKQQAQIAQLIETLRAEAEIEILI